MSTTSSHTLPALREHVAVRGVMVLASTTRSFDRDQLGRGQLPVRQRVGDAGDVPQIYGARRGS
jgi:hypothetical protein